MSKDINLQTVVHLYCMCRICLPYLYILFCLCTIHENHCYVMYMINEKNPGYFSFQYWKIVIEIKLHADFLGTTDLH